MRILYTEEAKKNIRDIFVYIAADNYDNAAAVRKRMSEAVGRLADFPDSGFSSKFRRLKLSGYRILMSDNYLIFYKLAEDGIIIAAVMHGSRKYNELLK